MPDQDIFPSQSDAVFAVAWYRPEQWQKLRRIAVDRRILEATHAEWLEIATKTLLDLKNMGLDVRRVEIDVDELLVGVRKISALSMRQRAPRLQHMLSQAG